MRTVSSISILTASKRFLKLLAANTIAAILQIIEIV